jgi:hypothetical protein
MMTFWKGGRIPKLRGFCTEVRSNLRETSLVSDDHPEVWGAAPLFALLLHWVQPLPTGAVGMEYKRCTSYRSNTQSASSKWHRLV